MRESRMVSFAAALVGLLAGSAGAQVGHDPAASPYRDINVRQEWTAFGGWLAAKKDPVGVAPQGGPLAGARYELYLAGPAFLVGRVAAAHSTRTVLDPTQPAATRVAGEESGPLGLVDVGLEVSLTGPRSYRSLVPVLGVGAGLATDFRSKLDLGGFGFGTRFALTGGAGIRWTPGGRVQLRADVSDYLYRINYPASYYVPASDNSSVLGPRDSRSVWTHNVALTLGASYLFLR